MDQAIIFLQEWHSLAYVLIFIGMFIEGETVLFAASFLAARGILDPVFVIVLSFVGTCAGDFLWHYIGDKIKYSNFFLIKWAEKLAGPFDTQLKKNPGRMIFISKFTYGLHHAILIRSGMLGLSRKRYARIIIPSIIFWVIVISGVGMFFGASLHLLKKYVKYAEIFLLLMIVLIFLSEKFMAKISREKLTEHEKNPLQ